MKQYIDIIFDASENAGCTIVEIETKAKFSKVKFERDFLTFELLIDHRDSFTKIAMDISTKYHVTQVIYLAKKN